MNHAHPKPNPTIFTSESVGVGHPDKVCDLISDAILDHCLQADPRSRVACETLVKDNTVVLAGEITTDADLGPASLEAIVRSTIREIGYTDPAEGFHSESCRIINLLGRQSQDIAMGVDREDPRLQGAGDQGIMFGYATRETQSGLPITLHLAHHLSRALRVARENQVFSYLRPDCKTQVSVAFDGETQEPRRIDAVVLSTQHTEDVDLATLRKDMRVFVLEVLPHGDLIDSGTIFHINPTGRFVVGGPVGDSGLTGRKIIVDTYGGAAPHGGGAFSGKDPSKVDRSAAYMARHISRTIVEAGLAHSCTLQLAYAIGVAEPVSIRVKASGSEIPNAILEQSIRKTFDLTPHGIIAHLDLLRPIYKANAFPGHFGMNPEAPWEAVSQDLTQRFVASL